MVRSPEDTGIGGNHQWLVGAFESGWPVEVLREAIINPVVHADHSRPGARTSANRVRGVKGRTPYGIYTAGIVRKRTRKPFGWEGDEEDSLEPDLPAGCPPARPGLSLGSPWSTTRFDLA